MDTLNLLCQRLHKLILHWGGRAHASVPARMFISRNLTFAVLHGKQFTAALLRVYSPASLSLTAPGYLTFSAI